MRRSCVPARLGLLVSLSLLPVLAPSASGDLIRAAPGRTFPDIAGDIGGSQTYVFDPATQTGTFAVVNAPHLIALGRSVKDLIPVQPDRQGTLCQELTLKLDRAGRLIDSPMNRFEIRGTVIINDRTYEGVLLEGRPTEFGIPDGGRAGARSPEVFGLNIQIERGKLADAFGTSAYLRIIPQENSTFRGEFTRDFSGERPLTNLIALDRGLSGGPWVGASGWLVAFVGAAGLLIWRIVRPSARSPRRDPLPRRRPKGHCASPSW